MTAHSPKLILPFTLETAIQKVRIAEDNWNSAILSKLRLRIPSTANGETELSSSRGERKLCSS
jgi:nuclear transport factor 2 (NTF2) superfamily protein